MYHSVSQGEGVSSWEWSVSSRYFSNHLDLLLDNGWKTACIRDLVSPDDLPEKTVFITFDDGYMDNYPAYKELTSRNMVATWFVVTNDIGKVSGWGDQEQRTKVILDRDRLLEMSHAGMEIGSHTCSHADLTLLDEADIRNELCTSKTALEELLGEKVHSFAYPYGRYNQSVISAVKKAGYEFAITCRSGWVRNNYDPLQIRRVAIFNGDSSSILSRKLAFADNNAGWGQVGKYFLGRVVKRVSIF